jgi:hypothetical protein
MINPSTQWAFKPRPQHDVGAVPKGIQISVPNIKNCLQFYLK